MVLGRCYSSIKLLYTCDYSTLRPSTIYSHLNFSAELVWNVFSYLVQVCTAVLFRCCNCCLSPEWLCHAFRSTQARVGGVDTECPRKADVSVLKCYHSGRRRHEWYGWQSAVGVNKLSPKDMRVSSLLPYTEYLRARKKHLLCCRCKYGKDKMSCISAVVICFFSLPFLHVCWFPHYHLFFVFAKRSTCDQN